MIESKLSYQRSHKFNDEKGNYMIEIRDYGLKVTDASNSWLNLLIKAQTLIRVDGRVL